MEDSVPEILLTKALGVYEDVSSYNPNENPSNGFEYLHQVICESSKLPQTMVADINPEKFKVNQTFFVNVNKTHSSKVDLLPTQEWQQIQVKNFLLLREKVNSMKEVWSKKKASCNHTDSLPGDIGNEEAWLNLCTQRSPLLQVLFSIQQPGILKLLSYFNSWLDDKDLSFCQNTTLWLYSLFACIEEPLMPSTFADIRDILRLAREKRSAIESVEDSQLSPLNLIICIGARCFQQTDLCD